MSAVETNDGLAAIECGDVLITLWQAPARIARVRWLNGLLERIAAKNAGGFVVLQLILPSSSPPDSETRALARDTFLRHGKSMRRLVTMPVGDAFWTNVVRAIMRTMVVVTGQAKTHFVASNERDALERIREIATPATPTPGVLGHAIEALYRALGESRPGAARASSGDPTA